MKREEEGRVWEGKHLHQQVEAAGILALVVVVGLMIGCPTDSGPSSKPGPARTEAPAVAAGGESKARIPATARSIDFTLTSSHGAGSVWKVYGAASGGSVITDVTAAFTSPTLTLTYSGDDGGLPARDYYVSVTEAPKVESTRLKLTVKEPSGVTVYFQGPADEAITLGETNSVAWNQALTVTASGTYAAYAWYLDGEAISGEDSGSVTIAAQTLRTGGHTLTVVVSVESGAIYSKTLNFTVSAVSE